MGLDMFAYVTDETPATPVDFPEPENHEELHYWRKHPNLHGWMERLYEAKGGASGDFNLAPMCEFRRNPAGDSDLKSATVPI